MVGERADSNGQLRHAVHRQREHVALRGRHVDQLSVPVLTEVGDFCRGVKARTQNGQRMVEQLDPPIAGNLFASALGAAVGRHPEGHLTVEPNVLALHVVACEQELGCTNLLDAYAVVRQIDLALVVSDLPDGQLIIREPVLTHVGGRPFSFDNERLDCLDSVGAPERLRRIPHHPHLGRRPCACRCQRGDYNDRQTVFHDVSPSAADSIRRTGPRRCQVNRRSLLGLDRCLTRTLKGPRYMGGRRK